MCLGSRDVGTEKKEGEEGHVHKRRRAETGSEPLLHRFRGNGKGKRGDKRERKVKDNQDDDTLCKSSKSYFVKQGRHNSNGTSCRD